MRVRRKVALCRCSLQLREPVAVFLRVDLAAREALAENPPRRVSSVVRPRNLEVANAVGAAIAQISGDADQIFPLAEFTRAKAIDAARELATRRAREAGAAERTIRIVEIEDVPVAYMEGSMLRVRAKAVGELGEAAAAADGRR